MRRILAIACVLAMMGGATLAQPAGAQAPAPRRTHAPGKTHAARKKHEPAKPKSPAMAAPPAAPLPAQITPPVPATLMNSAPVKPTVTMKDGLLTIDAPNSTLSDVLSGVQLATGAVVEGDMPGERVAIRLGPGDPRQVIAALLQGTPYNYVILGSPSSQDAVTRILLTHVSAAPATPNAAAASHPPPPPPMTPPAIMPFNPAMAQPSGEIRAMPIPQPPPPQPPQNQNQPKTPEQLFRALHLLPPKS